MLGDRAVVAVVVDALIVPKVKAVDPEAWR
jgi:hypothetical protein